MQDLWKSTLFALVLSISFGPVAFSIFRQSFTFGFLSALPAVFGAAVADAVFAAVAFAGLRAVEAFWAANSQLLTWAAIAYLFYLGVITFKKSAATSLAKRATGFIPVFLLTLTSPLTIAAISSYVIASEALLYRHGMYLNLLGFLLGSLSGQMLYALVGAMIKRALADPLDFGFLNRVSGGCLIAFAAWQLARVLET